MQKAVKGKTPTSLFDRHRDAVPSRPVAGSMKMAGWKLHPDSTGSPSEFGSRGFSLLELLIALSLMVAAIAMAPAYFSKGVSSAELKSGARQLASALSSTRARAIARNQTLQFLLDLDKRQFYIGRDSAPVAIDEALTLRLKTAESERINDHLGAIRFFPDGSSTGGEIRLGNGARSLRITVNWVTGKVRILEGE